MAGDVIELYAMRKESGIYKYCLIGEATFPLHMTSPKAVYPLIHTLLTLRTSVACTIHKILMFKTYLILKALCNKHSSLAG